MLTPKEMKTIEELVAERLREMTVALEARETRIVRREAVLADMFNALEAALLDTARSATAAYYRQLMSTMELEAVKR